MNGPPPRTLHLTSAEVCVIGQVRTGESAGGSAFWGDLLTYLRDRSSPERVGCRKVGTDCRCGQVRMKTDLWVSPPFRVSSANAETSPLTWRVRVGQSASVREGR